MSRRRHRAPPLAPWDRLVFGLYSLLMPPQRRLRAAIALKPSSFCKFHQALVRCEVSVLYTPLRRSRPGPKCPAKDIIVAIVEMNKRNSRRGCRKIAEQIAHAFGIEIDEDIVRRILAKHYHPDSDGEGISWVTAIAHAKDSLWSVDLFRCDTLCSS